MSLVRLCLACLPGTFRYKATFVAAIDVPNVQPPLKVFFNTAVNAAKATAAAASAAPGNKVFHFDVTKNPLPTYLVAVAVGHFDQVKRTSRGVDYSIITPPGYAAYAELGLNASIHAVEYFGDRFGVPYSSMNTKLDSISVAGIEMDAMENQGGLPGGFSGDADVVCWISPSVASVVARL